MRKLMGSIVGVIAALAIIFSFELLSSAVYPLPAELDSADPATLAHIIADMPFAAKALVVTGWLVGAFGGAWLALRIADWRWAGWIVAGVVLVGSIANLVALPHALWMQACAIILPLVGGWLAQRLHRKPYAGEPLLG